MTRDITQERREIEGVEIQLADDGELLVRGGNVAEGCYRDPEKSAATFDADSWLHTGDVGTIDVHGCVRTVDRKKDLIVSAVHEAAAESNRHVAQVEAVRRFTVLPVEWTAESDKLIPMLKLKRRMGFAKYVSQVDAMYAAPGQRPPVARFSSRVNTGSWPA